MKCLTSSDESRVRVLEPLEMTIVPTFTTLLDYLHLLESGIEPSLFYRKCNALI